MRRFEFVDGGSSKFWEISLEGSAFTVRFGRIGTNGQTQEKSFPTAEKARAEHDKLVAEKVKKGYVEISGDAAEAKPADVAPAEASPAPAPAPSEPKPKPKAKPAAPVEVPEIAAPAGEGGWLTVGEYGVQIQGAAIVARNKQGKVLSSLPKQLKDAPEVEQLREAAEWLADHEAECKATVEGWLLRSLPAPTAALRAVWPDPAWRVPIENAVIQPLGGSGSHEPHARGYGAPLGEAGILRTVDPVRGLGLVTLDGETIWVTAAAVAIPHPILLAELDEWRAMLAHLGLSQGTDQLFRETFPKPAAKVGSTNVDAFQNGSFDMLAQVNNEARKLGYRTSGGCALCKTWSNGVAYEARFWVGEGDPMYETVTGDLWWVDGKQKTVEIAALPPVAFSEGMRMASAIYARRKIETQENADA